jgi:hypothetical protein
MLSDPRVLPHADLGRAGGGAAGAAVAPLAAWVVVRALQLRREVVEG